MEIEDEEQTRESKREEGKKEKGDEEEMNMGRQNMTQNTDTRKTGEDRRQKYEYVIARNDVGGQVFRES